MDKPTPRPSLSRIKPYVPGKASAGSGVSHKLSSNESALGPAPSATEALARMAGEAHLYPDGSATSLRERIGALHHLPPQHLIVGSGSDELLSLAVRCFTMPGDQVLMTKHGFSYYPLAAMAEGCEPVMAEEEDLHADVDALLGAVTPATKLLFLANPNNPTGTLLDQDALMRLRAELPSPVMLVLDGAYAEYIDEPGYDAGAALVADAIHASADNVIMTRTFSKIYGLGGLRVGWAYAAPSVIDIMNRVRGPFNVSASGLAAAEAALDDQAFVKKNRQHNDEEMARLNQRLGGLGLNARTTRANFVLLEFSDHDEASAFLRACETDGVLIRGLASSNLPSFVRVSIGSREANDAFLRCAEQWAERHADGDGGGG